MDIELKRGECLLICDGKIRKVDQAVAVQSREGKKVTARLACAEHQIEIVGINGGHMTISPLPDGVF